MRLKFRLMLPRALNPMQEDAESMPNQGGALRPSVAIATEPVRPPPTRSRSRSSGAAPTGPVTRPAEAPTGPVRSERIRLGQNKSRSC